MTRVIKVTKYWPHSNPDFSGNPLIEAFAAIKRKKMAEMMVIPVIATVAERTHSLEERLQYLWRLSRFFIPTPPQLDFACEFWRVLLEGYRSRNPLKVKTTETFNAFCEAIGNDEVFINDDDSFMNSPFACTLIGTPGTGKGRTVQSLLRNFPSTLLHHVNHGPLYQLLYVYVEAPDTDGYISLLEEIYSKLYTAACAMELPVPRLPINSRRGHYENAIATLAAKLNLGFLIVDEIQHLVGGNKVDKKTMKFLTGFVNRIGVPVLLIGTWPALAVLESELRLARRTVNRGSARFYRMYNDESWEQFIQALFRLQWTADIVEFENITEEERQKFIDIFYYHCQGIADLAVKLMMLAQANAIREDIEKLDVSLIDEAAKEHMPMVASAVRQMREGRKFEDQILWDLEPTDFVSYFKALLADVAGREHRRSKRKLAAGDALAKRTHVIEGLLASGYAQRDGAEALADRALASAPDKSAPELVSKIISDNIYKGPRPSKSKRKQEETDNAFQALGDSDLRKIVYFAGRNGTSAADALSATGHITSMLDEGLL